MSLSYNDDHNNNCPLCKETICSDGRAAMTD